MLRRHSEQSTIKLLNNDAAKTASAPKIPEDKHSLETLAEQQKAKHLNNKDDGYMTNRHIRSAGSGNITDMGGPQKQAKTETSPSIWDADRLSKMQKELDSKSKTRLEKESLKHKEIEKESERRNLDLAEAIKHNMEKKPSRLSDHSGSNYKTPTQSMSIFDTKDFERLPEKTAGEQVAEESRQRKAEKDDSWKGNGKSVSSQDVVNRLFDNLTGKNE